MKEALNQIEARAIWHAENIDDSQPYGRGLREGLAIAISILKNRIEAATKAPEHDLNAPMMTIAEIVGVPDFRRPVDVVRAVADLKRHESDLQGIANGLAAKLVGCSYQKEAEEAGITTGTYEAQPDPSKDIPDPESTK